MLQQSRELADLAAVLATILLILFIGILIELVVFGPLEKGVLRRRGLTGTPDPARATSASACPTPHLIRLHEGLP